MKKLVLLLTVLVMVHVSGMALEPVRVGLTYPSGRQGANPGPTVSLTVFDYSSQSQVYPAAGGSKDFGQISSNRSGGAQFIVGEGDPEWQNLTSSVANNATMVRVYLDGEIAAQLKLKDLVNAQQTTGDGSVLNKGISESGGTITSGSDTTSLVIGSQSVQYTDTTNAPETKMFFNDAKASFRAGTVSSTAWDSTNLGQSSVAFGENTKATGTHSFASGLGTVAEATYEVAVGSYNTDDTPAGTSADKAFSVGNGTADASRSNAFVVRKNGNTEVSGTLTVGNYTLPSADGQANQMLQTDGSGVLSFVDILGTANTWTGAQTFGDVTLSGKSNASLYVDANGLVTASNGAAARTASGMTTGKQTAVASVTQTITNSAAKTGSTIIVTIQGATNATYRVSAISDGVSFELTFSPALTTSDSIHYMIIND